MKEDLDGEEAAEECYGGGEEFYINYEIWRRGGILFLAKIGCYYQRERLKVINCGRETRCSWNFGHEGRGGVLWI